MGTGAQWPCYSIFSCSGALSLVQAHLQVAKTLRHLAMAYPMGAPERKEAVERALPILYTEVRCMMKEQTA